MTTFVQPSSRSTGDVVTASIWNTDIVTNMAALAESEIVWYPDGGGAVYDTGFNRPFRVRFDAQIVKAWVLHDQAATATFKIHKVTYASYSASPSGDITNGGFGSSAAIKAEDGTLTGWTVDISSGDIVFLEVVANDVALWSAVGIDLNYGQSS